MAGGGDSPAGLGATHHGLRFMNEDWNESISNGHTFTLRWNESLEGIAAELGVFKVTYPEDGLVNYELVTNLTESLSVTHCEWTPEGLADELYTLWLTAKTHTDIDWAISPPWRPKEKESHAFRWSSPVGIPIVVILALYALGVGTCLMYRRRKKAEERTFRAAPGDAIGGHSSVERHNSNDDYDPEARHPTAHRNSSVDSGTTANTISDPEEARKHDETWLFMDATTETRRPSDGTISTASMDRASEDTAVETQWLQQAHVQPGPSWVDRRRYLGRQNHRGLREAWRPESW